MDEIKSLSKHFAILSFLKCALAIITLISIGVLIVGFTILFLYLYYYPPITIIISAISAWFIYLIILGMVVYFNQQSFNRKKTKFIHLMNKELYSVLGLKAVNGLLRKFRKFRTKTTKVETGS